MITNEIGLNAGKIWNELNEHGDQPVKNLMKRLSLSSPDYYMAIGWLAREGKVRHYKNEAVMMICLKG